MKQHAVLRCLLHFTGCVEILVLRCFNQPQGRITCYKQFPLCYFCFAGVHYMRAWSLSFLTTIFPLTLSAALHYMYLHVRHTVTHQSIWLANISKGYSNSCGPAVSVCITQQTRAVDQLQYLSSASVERRRSTCKLRHRHK